MIGIGFGTVKYGNRIVKKGNRYYVKDSRGIKTLGSHDTQEQAIAQLLAIEASKKKPVNKT